MAPIPKLTETMTGLTTFGSMCRKSILGVDVPIARAASTYSASLEPAPVHVPNASFRTN